MVHWSTALNAAEPPQVTKRAHVLELDSTTQDLTTTGADEILKSYLLRSWHFDPAAEEELIRVHLNAFFPGPGNNTSLSVEIGGAHIYTLAEGVHAGRLDITVVADINADASGLVSSYFGHLDGTLEAGSLTPVVDMSVDQEITVVGQGVALTDLDVTRFTVEVIK